MQGSHPAKIPAGTGNKTQGHRKQKGKGRQPFSEQCHYFFSGHVMAETGKQKKRCHKHRRHMHPIQHGLSGDTPLTQIKKQCDAAVVQQGIDHQAQYRRNETAAQHMKSFPSSGKTEIMNRGNQTDQQTGKWMPDPSQKAYS